ncbi:hypothetical protein ACJ5NV_17265 [Loktanella agnita]|uniref:hypothetical protein n=1 Tax=Loktanella agnita TaxID=287097 RepID=UPI003989C7F8
MKRIKIIDVPLYETDPNVIADHLTDFLKAVRKSKFQNVTSEANDSYAGFDDIDVFGDESSDSVELSYSDKRRITAKANKLSKRRVAAAGVSHLKSEEYDRLKPSVGSMQIVMAKDLNWADEIAAELHSHMPWMGRATEYAWHALQRSAQRGEPVLKASADERTNPA